MPCLPSPSFFVLAGPLDKEDLNDVILFVAASVVLHCVIPIKKRSSSVTVAKLGGENVKNSEEEKIESVTVEESNLKCPQQEEMSDLTIKDEFTEEIGRSE